jgi:hypothetical protein
MDYSQPIPVSFELKGCSYKGYLSQPNGVGTYVWHLTVPEVRNGKVGTYHWGLLVIYKDDDWRMTSNQHDLSHLSAFFRDVVLNWFQ